jgi:sporulation protein YlmC with PRC-barrel domain
MLKKHMAACLVVTAFAAAPALAQTSTTPSGSTDRPTASGSGSTATGSSAMQPTTGATGTGSAATGSSTMSQAGSQGGAMQGQFMTQMQPNQVMASKLIGTRVVSSNNESIGDINDVIVDRNGQAIAAVVGVGGFLGIGEKDVAVPFNSLEFMTAQQASAMNANGNNATAPATTGSTAGAGTTGVAGTTGSTAGSGAMTSGNTASNNAGASGNMASDGPDRVVLRMTKAELQAAPAFDGNSNASGSGTTAPKQ